MRDDFRTLRILIAASDAGSFTAAGVRLGVETSAISRVIRDLEDQLGVALFVREPRGIALTTAGLAYVEAARCVLARMRQAEVAARLAGEGRHGGIRLGYVCSFSVGPIVDLLKRHRASSPDVVLQLFEFPGTSIFRMVKEHELDVVITNARSLCLNDNSYSRLRLWTERLCVAVPDTLQSDWVSWKDLSNEHLLCRPSDDWWLTLSTPGGPTSSTLRFLPQDVSRESLLGLVAAGCGWAIVPESFKDIAVKGVRVVPIVLDTAFVDVDAFWKASNENPALSRFLALAREMYGETRSSRLNDAPLRTHDLSP